MSWVAAGSAGAGLLSGLIGSSGAKQASSDAKKTAKRALHLQRDMYQDQVQRGEKLTANQIRTIRAGRDQTQSLAEDERYRLGKINRDERDANQRLGQDTARANAGRLVSDRGATLNALAGDRDANLHTLKVGREQTIGNYRDATDANLRAIKGARDQSLGDSYRSQGANITGIEGARDRSIANFQPALGLGNNALSAYGAELGLGDGPEGWGGLSMTPGAEFRLNEGYKGLQGSAAGRGGLNSGATLAAMEEYRQGLATTDRDTQMAQLMTLGGVGQNAASNIANIDMGAAGDIAAQRNTGTGLRANLRSGASSQITGARQWGTEGENAALRDYGGAIVGERNYNAGAANNARQYYGNALNQNRTANLGYQTGVNSDFAGSQAQREVGYADRATNSANNYTANMGAARSNMMSGGQQAAQGYASGGANALASMGDAAAAGAIGSANAWTNGINNALGTYGYLSQGGFQNPFGNRQAPAQQNVNAQNTPPPMARPW